MQVLRPARRLPRQFRRRVHPRLRTFVEQRHGQRGRNWSQYLRTRWRRAVVVFGRVGEWLRRYAVIILGSVFGIGIIVLLTSPVLAVREIEVVRQYGRLDVGAVQQRTKDLFGHRLLFVSAGMVRERIADAVPDLADVSIAKHYPSRLVISVTLQPLVAKLAISGTGGLIPSPPMGTGAVQGVDTPAPPLVDYLTDRGVYVQALESQSGAGLPLVKIEDWSVRPQPGALLMQPTLFQSLQQAEGALATEFGFVTKYRTVYVRGQEYHLSNGKVSLWFDGRTPVSKQLTRYRLFLKAIGLKNVTRYIDLRLSGKVVYR